MKMKEDEWREVIFQASCRRTVGRRFLFLAQVGWEWEIREGGGGCNSPNTSNTTQEQGLWNILNPRRNCKYRACIGFVQLSLESRSETQCSASKWMAPTPCETWKCHKPSYNHFVVFPQRIGAIETGTEQRRLQQPKSSASDVDLNGSACLPPPKKKDGLLAYLRFEGG